MSLSSAAILNWNRNSIITWKNEKKKKKKKNSLDNGNISRFVRSLPLYTCSWNKWKLSFWKHTLRFFYSYLTRRNQHVNISKSKSCFRPFNLGVTERWTLWPVLIDYLAINYSQMISKSLYEILVLVTFPRIILLAHTLSVLTSHRRMLSILLYQNIYTKISFVLSAIPCR